MNTQHIWYWGS